MTEANPRRGIVALAVGPTMGERIRHARKNLMVYFTFAVEIEDARYAAHRAYRDWLRLSHGAKGSTAVVKARMSTTASPGFSV